MYQYSVSNKKWSLFKLSWLLYLLVGWLVVLVLAALWGSISVYIGPSPREREKEERKRIEESKNVQTTRHPHLLQAQ